MSLKWDLAPVVPLQPPVPDQYFELIFSLLNCHKLKQAANNNMTLTNGIVSTPNVMTSLPSRFFYSFKV